MTLTYPTSAPAPARAPQGPPRAPVLDVVLPVHDEAGTLEASVRRVRGFLDAHVPYPARVTVVDNASTDGTDGIAVRLAATVPGVVSRRLEAKGRGRALRAAWLGSDAAVLVYMDMDLSTDLSALLPLVAPLVSGHSHLAVGTRLARGSRVVRGPKREVISRGYNLLVRGTLALRVSDAQCGFKAIRADVARELLPLTGQLIRFATVGVVSTAAFSLLYLVLASPLGPQGANLVALLVTAVANTAANRRVTFGVRGRRDAWRHHTQGLGVFVLGWVLTAGALAVLHTTTQPSRATEPTSPSIGDAR